MPWRRIWGGPSPVEEVFGQNRSLVSHWISGALFLERLLGNYQCGLVVLEAYFTDKPGVTADYVSARLDGQQSPDTTRRYLNGMARSGKVTISKVGRAVYFKLEPTVAEAAIAFMKGDQIRLPEQRDKAA